MKKKIAMAFMLITSALFTGIGNAGVNLKSVEFDIHQLAGFGGYIDSKSANVMATQLAKDILKQAGLLDTSSEKQVTIYIGYQRGFWRDDTPNPINRLGSIKVSEGFLITEKGKVISEWHKYSGELSAAFQNGLFKNAKISKQEARYQRDFQNIAVTTKLVTQSLVEHLYSDNKRFEEFKKSKKPEFVKSMYLFYELMGGSRTPESSSISNSKAYIPTDVIEDFRQRVASYEPKTRIEAYKALVKYPINDKVLLDTVSENLVTGITSAAAHTDAQAWAAKVLGAAGFIDYIEALEKTASSSIKKKVQKHAKNSLAQLKREPNLGINLHNTKNRGDSQSWQSLQVVNQINSGRVLFQTAAAKEVYNAGKTANEFMKEALAEQLQRFSMNYSMRTGASVDFHAWALKALAATGDKQYLPLLKKIAKSGYYKKTKKFAKASAKTLRKSK